ncbi:MAG: hypothetical protein HYV07_16435 [Deltaproteobacteria bacterium]|nr:hypothetical protein [Deltaproteobacteria bacterium]
MCLLGCDPEPLAALPDIDVEPWQIAFGQVGAGRTRAVELTITNTSPLAILELQSLELLGDTTTFSYGSPPSTLGPSESFTIAVRHTADDGTGDGAELSIRSNASAHPEVRVALLSSDTAPALEVAPRELVMDDTVSGSSRVGEVRVSSVGLAPLELRRLSLRTEGFAGEACGRDADCREGRCTLSATGSICAVACEGACTAGYRCTLGLDGYRACREDDGTRPPRAARGFSIGELDTAPLFPEAFVAIPITYAPSPTDRGSAQLLIETNDPERPTAIVSLRGRPENQPPTAIVVAAVAGEARPGTIVALDGRGSFDPEGGPIEHAWRFVHRPASSRAAFSSVRGSTTSFTIDLPGHYVAELEVRDETGLVSTNEARSSVDALPGPSFRVFLDWDRADTDLDLHLVRPRAPAGSVGDCYFDNPSPDWGAPGPSGDPELELSAAGELITMGAPESGVYTILVRVVATSPQGGTAARVRLEMGSVEAAVLDTIIPASATSWDVATLSWPTGTFVPLGTLR